MKINRLNIYSIFKHLLQIGTITFFISLFIKLFNQIQSVIILKFIFIITYLWFTIGINVNLIMPLIKLLDEKK